MRRNELKAKLATGEVAANGWLSTDSCHVAEALSHVGYDSVTVDLQHGMYGAETAIAMLRAVSCGPATPMARSSSGQPSEIMKLLDAGAYGIICPDVNTAQEAQILVESCRYAPDGRRSFGPARGLLYGGQDYPQHANEEILTWAMIESADGVTNLADIVDTPGLDGLYIGPNDLSLALGAAPGAPLEDRITTVIADIISHTRAADKNAGIFARNDDEARLFVELGANFVTPGADLAIITDAARRRIASLKPEPTQDR